MAAPKNSPPSSDAKTASKMHRRSRSGCFTCRLRRKKCEEGRPACKACTHLGLRCDYKRPIWWSNTEQRRHQKELIKDSIKRTQVSKKAAQSQQQSYNTSSPPPPLSHSVPSSAEPQFAESFPQSRCSSESSPLSTGCDLNYVTHDGYFGMHPAMPHFLAPNPHFPMFSPYEVDIKTEREIYVNDVPTRKDSTLSTFSTYQPPSVAGSDYPADSWIQQEHFESTCEAFTEEPVNVHFFDLPHEPLTPNHEAVITVDDSDKHLLNHFLEKIVKSIFPVLEADQHGSARSDIILPALETNKAYLHSCLSIAATHMKSTSTESSEQLDKDIINHRYAAISELCEAFGRDADHMQILEAALAMMFFQCSVGQPEDSSAEIPWHQHFQAVTDMVHKLDLHNSVIDSPAAPPFNMTLTSWIDILGSTIVGRHPAFSDTYRDMNSRGASLGLAELMGCEDRIMYLISEIACLDFQKTLGIDEATVCTYVASLGAAITQTEIPAGSVVTCFSPTGAIRPKQLTINMTAVFRVAARIYLCTLVPGHVSSEPSMCHLISQFSELMNFIPAGTEGFDRSLCWPLLVAGASSLAASPFRAMFQERCDRLGEAANYGSFGRVREVLKDLWQANDAAALQGDFQGIRWRDAIHARGWQDFLLI